MNLRSYHQAAAGLMECRWADDAECYSKAGCLTIFRLVFVILRRAARLSTSIGFCTASGDAASL